MHRHARIKDCSLCIKNVRTGLWIKVIYEQQVWTEQNWKWTKLNYLRLKAIAVEWNLEYLSPGYILHTVLENLLGLFWCLYKYFAEMFYPGTHKIKNGCVPLYFNVYTVDIGLEITMCTDQ